jgi:hypothetical protein
LWPCGGYVLFLCFFFCFFFFKKKQPRLSREMYCIQGIVYLESADPMPPFPAAAQPSRPASYAKPLSLLCLALTALCPHNQPIRPVIDLGYAKYEGLQLTNGVDAFLGMRFAAAPLGDLRWRAPVEPPKIEGLQRANHVCVPVCHERVSVLMMQFPPICLGINAGYPASGQDEDCLFANVWAPSKATPTSKLPVWIFIGGGGEFLAASLATWLTRIQDTSRSPMLTGMAPKSSRSLARTSFLSTSTIAWEPWAFSPASE